MNECPFKWTVFQCQITLCACGWQHKRMVFCRSIPPFCPSSITPLRTVRSLTLSVSPNSFRICLDEVLESFFTIHRIAWSTRGDIFSPSSRAKPSSPLFPSLWHCQEHCDCSLGATHLLCNMDMDQPRFMKGYNCVSFEIGEPCKSHHQVCLKALLGDVCVCLWWCVFRHEYSIFCLNLGQSIHKWDNQMN
jgi:hypothetical protein